jgi:ech hydrogenase subunit D
MNAPVQRYVEVQPDALLEAVRAQQLTGSRLVQICCTKLAGFELTYSFARAGAFDHVRVQIPDNTVKVPSISPIYSCSFAYENEIHDLFGLSFLGLNIDYKGTFYKTTIPAPMVGTPVCGAPAPKDKGAHGE